MKEGQDMSLRNNIYYWKCDSPLSIEEKKKSYFKEKYSGSDIEDVVKRACTEHLGKPPKEISAAGCDGNHFAYIVTYPDRKYFFRADGGSSGDDYMLAESRLMKLVSETGVPVPNVYHTDVEMKRYPVMFQIMDLIEGKSLSVYHRNNELQVDKVAYELGIYMRRLHSVKMDGFGFVDTDLLKKTGTVKCLDEKYPEYFYKRLDDHLEYLSRNDLLSLGTIDEIRQLFRKYSSLLNLDTGVLVHRDLALWNVLGTPDRITAIIDWDDAVGGDPADDLGILQCFYEDDFMAHVFSGYFGDEKMSQDFQIRIWLHTLRNMLWKTMIRDYMGYFKKGKDFFLSGNTGDISLKEYTFLKIERSMNILRNS
jgi:aminoglycoside phosphotransferase (APT) family kinase protein